MKQPSTDWHEIIAPDEDARFVRQGELIKAAHAIKNKQYGKGRFLHRKEIVGAKGMFEVYAGLPDYAAQGIFKTPGTYPAIVRMSNGGLEIQANTKPDIRGFAVRVLGIAGPGALGRSTDHQDFLMINHDVFGSRDSDEFVGVAANAARGPLALAWYLIKTQGVGVALKKLKALTATLGKPFAGYAAEKFNTVVPHMNGPYAVKVMIRPLAPAPANGKDYQTDIKDKLTAGSVDYEMSLQFYTDDKTTPIEDHQALWPESETPIVPVGRLTLTEANAEVESLALDPWSGLAEHRPLGEIMRARKSAYFLSVKARKL
jgi:hypothetical protein